MLVKTGNLSVLIAGGLRVAVAANVEGVRDENGATDATFRPGQKFTIFGTDLAHRDGTGSPLLPGGPLPTQVAGISVRVADRFALIESVSSSSIVAVVPDGIQGEEADVVVHAGTTVQSKAVKIKLGQ